MVGKVLCYNLILNAVGLVGRKMYRDFSQHQGPDAPQCGPGFIQTNIKLYQPRLSASAML